MTSIKAIKFKSFELVNNDVAIHTCLSTASTLLSHCICISSSSPPHCETQLRGAPRLTYPPCLGLELGRQCGELQHHILAL